MTADHVISAVWCGLDDEPDSARKCISLYIFRIRRVIRELASADRLETVWGAGYIWWPGEAAQPFCPSSQERAQLVRLIRTHPDQRFARRVGARMHLL